MEQALEVLDGAEQIVTDIGIPPCPAILTRLVQEMRNDEPDFAKLGKLVGADVSLAAAMVKTVNSPFYGLRSKATSVQQAMALLGLRQVAELVTSLLMRDVFPGGPSEVMEEYWESSSAIAALSAALARELKCASRDEVYTFTLFRDCGMLAMMGAFNDYKPLLPGARASGDRSVTDAEEDCYGTNHARVGCQLARTWLLPDELCQSVLRHHSYAALLDGSAGVSAASAKHIALALVAEAVYVQHKIGTPCAEWRKGGAFALAVLDITQDEMDEAAQAVIGEVAL